MEMLGQLSLFDGGLPGRTTAVNLLYHGKFQTKGIAAWMMRLVPKVTNSSSMMVSPWRVSVVAGR